MGRSSEMVSNKEEEEEEECFKKEKHHIVSAPLELSFVWMNIKTLKVICTDGLEEQYNQLESMRQVKINLMDHES